MTERLARTDLPVDRQPVRSAARTTMRGFLAGLFMAAFGFMALAASGGANELRANLAALRSDSPVANAAGVRTPALRSPADDAVVDAVPAFSWSSVKGGVMYEFQLSADPDFGSLVLTAGNH